MGLEKPIVVVANGPIPEFEVARQAVAKAGTLICCDGAANHFVSRTRQPDLVIGDLDSISPEARETFSDRLMHFPEQDSGDLEKVFRYVSEQGVDEVVVVGITGGRQDHVLGNLLLAFDFPELSVSLIVVDGLFRSVRGYRVFKDAYKGQPVSLFTYPPETRITTEGLKYPLSNEPLRRPQGGMSNEAMGNQFSIRSDGGIVLVYQAIQQ